ncbi:MAG: hypothetical protein UR69_C0003G0015 [Candidatus Moranbacteria bacterium GW2011_GWE2_35_2-]|nr:MAG: hypothetical protein UR69_C0003G0015 [Candidatus Moranbacteria bacterium GW2011_GWE2_35_2-]KKQ05211.1 MAG: hypothetical protein US15_C0032G0004 [Candidatus Moranbacteria bacterium GW2011_GWF1_36_4]KKQ21711.1 MAG: hypothetical protein US37_C0009G0006 [Candidatus Moranbacteria bacterium GW2011_GWF2_37_11]KKQ28458.1 MAG: hypothetical protein US44_C0011G0006 [Candidatus Moranbacteria bacterium GW2011_GWD1_37_17]KKQ31197.1 MAG: hypothetical protein US47_C0001G0431 [Candidatus Moranbacteria b
MNKKVIIIIAVAVLILGALGIWKFWGGKGDSSEENTKQVYQAMVAVRDQKNSDPVEDARNSLKAGDVILVKSGENNPWSDTEKASNLILKMELNEEQAQKLVESVTEKLGKDEKKSQLAEYEKSIKENSGQLDEEEMKRYEEELDGQENVVVLRKYRIDFDEIDFVPEKWSGTQLFDGKIFNWSIVEKK